jgi:hypothetical protein
MCAQSVTPKSDGLNQPVELPWLVEIANSLPGDVESPDWGVVWHSSRPEYEPIVALARRAAGRVGIDLERARERSEALRFQLFMDENFPREQYPEFRDLIDGPDLGEMALQEQGLETISTPRSSLANYRFFATIRRALREWAKLGSHIAARARPRGKKKKRRLLYPLRICVQCGNLYIARRNNNRYCDPKKCGNAFRQARKRGSGGDRQEGYEVKRQQKMAARELERKLKKGA